MYIKNSKTIVIKIGSSLIVNDKNQIRKKWLSEFSKDINELLNNKKNVIIVSSGAIALGCKKLKLNKKNIKLDKSQAVASIGQIELMNLFKKTFNSKKINLSQILITLEDTEQRRRAINAKRTFDNLFKLRFVPIVNENDSIATSEIKYGDNDRLASRVAQISSADCLILLSDVDGLYTKNPKIYKEAKLIKEIKNIISNNYCTWFLPKISKLDARKKWIISSISPKGELIIDDGAIGALKQGKSLLAAGIKQVNGKFNKGDHIKILDKNMIEYARGLSSFTSDEISKIKGQHSNKIFELLGYITKSEVIHKDDMVEI